MPTPGKLEVTIKINELPSEVGTTKNGWKEFKLDCGGRIVTVALRPRMWMKLEEAAKQWPLWLGAITGQMGQPVGTGFVLVEPAVQVFERKPRPEAGKAEADAPPADQKPPEPT